MRYTVIWRSKAEARLAQLWLQASDRNDVARAADRIDQRLHVDPEQQAEVSSGDLHSVVVHPLGFLYRVLPDDRIVEVAWVWRSAPQG